MKRLGDDARELGPDVVRRLLPHRPPLLLVDRIHAFSPGDVPSLRASRQISASEPVFAGHFPQLSLWPGVYTVEGLGQACNLLYVLLGIRRALIARGDDPAVLLAGLRNAELGFTPSPGFDPARGAALAALLPDHRTRMGMAAHIDIKLVAPVFAGCRLDYRVELLAETAPFVRARALAPTAPSWLCSRMLWLLACADPPAPTGPAPKGPAPKGPPADASGAAAQAAHGAPVLATPWSGPWTIRVFGEGEGAGAIAAAFGTTATAWTERPRPAPGEVAVVWLEPGETRSLESRPGPQGETVVVLDGDAAWREKAATELPWKSLGVVDPHASWAEWSDTVPSSAALGAMAADEIGRHFTVSREPYAGSLPPGLDARLGPWSPTLLTSPDPRTRAEAARAAPAGTDLHALVADPFVGVRLAVAEHSPADRVALSADPDPLVRARAADGLDDVARLDALTRDPSSVVRLVATDRLGRARLAAEPLRAALASHDAYQRWKAAWGLGYFKGSTSVLIPLLKDEDIDVRREAARSLGRLGDREAIPALLEAVRDDNSFVRRWAAASLGEIATADDTAVREALRTVAREPTALVAQAAVHALSRYGEHVPKPFFTPMGRPADDAAIQKLLTNPDATTRKDVCKFLAGRADAGPWLATLAGDRDSEVRKSAVEAMGWSPATAPAAAAFLSDPDMDVRVTALDSLRRGQAGTVDAVAPLLSANDAELRLRAAEALAELGPSPALAALATDPDERVRAAVAVVSPIAGDPSLVVRIHHLEGEEVALAPWLHGVLTQEDELVHVRFSWNDDEDRPAGHRSLRPPVVRTYGHPDRG